MKKAPMKQNSLKPGAVCLWIRATPMYSAGWSAVQRRRGRLSTASLFMMRRRAFTLIELLVVIAILATLIAILLPSLAAARESGRNTKCMSNLRSIGTSLTLYAADHKETFPYWSGWHIWGRAGTPQDGTSGDDVGPGWTEQLIPYSSTKDVYSDPSRPKAEAPFCYFLQARYTSAIYNRNLPLSA